MNILIDKNHDFWEIQVSTPTGLMIICHYKQIAKLISYEEAKRDFGYKQPPAGVRHG
jgi:hypothetical protein